MRVHWLQDVEDTLYVLVRWYAPRGTLKGSRLDVLVWDDKREFMLIRAHSIIRVIILHPHPEMPPASWEKPTAGHMAPHKRVVHNMLFDDLP